MKIIHLSFWFSNASNKNRIQISLSIRKKRRTFWFRIIEIMIKKRNFRPSFMFKNHRCRTFIHFHTHLKDHQIVPKFKFLYQFEKDLSKSKRNRNFQTHFMIKNENFRPSFNHDKVNSAQTTETGLLWPPTKTPSTRFSFHKLDILIQMSKTSLKLTLCPRLWHTRGLCWPF